MSDSDKTVDYNVNASADGFVDAMGKAQASAKQSAKEVEKAWNSVGDQFKSVQAIVGTMLAVLAGGKAFKEVIDATVDWGSETGKLSKQLQISTAEASAYQVAARRLGIEAGALVDASDKMTKQLSKNEGAFKVLGVETRNANGSFRATGELLPEVMDKLRGITNVTEQNVAGQQVFGKGWGEVRSALKLSAEEMERARQKVKDLNLEVNPKDVRAYKEGLNDVKLVGTALSVQVGKELLPVLTEMGAVVGQNITPAMAAFKVVLQTVTVLAANVAFVFQGVGREIGAVMAQLSLTPKEALSGGWTAISDAVKADGVRARAELDALEARLMGVGGAKPAADEQPKGDGGKHYKFKSEGDTGDDKSRVSGWESQLEAAKAAIERQGMAEDQFRQRSMAENLAFWQQLLQRKDLTEAEKTQITRKAAEVEMAMIRETFEVKVKALEAESAQYKTNFAEKIRIETEIQAKYAQGTKEFEASQGRINALRREEAAQARQVAQARVDAERQAGLATIALEEQTLQQAARLGIVSQEQVLQQQLGFEERRNAIAAAALEERLVMAEADPDRNPVLLAQIHGQQEAQEQQHQQRIAQIRGNLQATQLDPIVKTYQAAEVALGNAIEGMINRTMTLGQAMKSIWKSIVSTIISELSKMLAKKIATWAVERAMTMAGIGADAVKAGSGAAASQASIPYVGPILAIAAMASIMGQVNASKSSVPSARMGYDIPAGLNPLTQLHEREMVLPAKHADTIRALSDGGAAAGGGGMQVHIHATDAKSVERLFMANGPALVKSIQKQVRGFAGVDS